MKKVIIQSRDIKITAEGENVTQETVSAIIQAVGGSDDPNAYPDIFTTTWVEPGDTTQYNTTFSPRPNQ